MSDTPEGEAAVDVPARQASPSSIVLKRIEIRRGVRSPHGGGGYIGTERQVIDIPGGDELPDDAREVPAETPLTDGWVKAEGV